MRRARRLRVGVGLVAGWRHRGVDWLAVARAVARDLERATAKAAILEAYLNTVYFGQGAYGVQAPAKAFFSTSADRLTLPQAALLAGMIRAPVAHDPFRHPRAALARRATALERHGHLRPAARARARPPPPRGAVVRGLGGGPAAGPG
ncbi:MAG: transglycosylase domain-containing protein, partial [Actinomycetota bacterium]